MKLDEIMSQLCDCNIFIKTQSLFVGFIKQHFQLIYMYSTHYLDQYCIRQRKLDEIKITKQ